MSQQSTSSEDSEVLSEVASAASFGGSGSSQDYDDSLSDVDGDAAIGAGEPPIVEKPAARIAEEDDEEEEEVPDIGAPTNLVMQVVRVPREERRTSHHMSPAEYSAVMSARINQIEAHGRTFATTAGITARKLAQSEMRERRCPILLIRRVGQRKNTIFEEAWDPSEMAYPIIANDL
jgi:hypothetical protein